MLRIELGVGHPNGGELITVNPLVNAVASHSILPESLLRRLGVAPRRRLEFTLADGNTVEYDYGLARFRIEGEEWPCPVLFGPEDVYALGGSALDIFNLEEEDGRLSPSKWLYLGIARQDSDVAEDIRPTMVVPQEDYHIWLRYSDGVEGEVDLSNLAGSGVFSAWDDRAVFESARLDSNGAVVWDEGIELCGDALYMQLTSATTDVALSTTQIPVVNA